VGKRIPTVNYSLTKEIGTYTANGLAIVEFKFMTTSVLACGAVSTEYRRDRQTDGRTDEQTSFDSIVRGVGLWRRKSQSE